MSGDYYETERAISEYLLFHYGRGELQPFPARCVTQCLDARRLPRAARALDLGCAVGRATFELARRCVEVVGIDYSSQFIALANRLRKSGSLSVRCIEEGELTRRHRVLVPKEIDRRRVHFEHGDAMNLRAGLGRFDVVLMANLIDRLSHPRQCLKQLPALLTDGGQLVITSPYTWLLEYTARKDWLGGFLQHGKPVRTLDTLRQILSPHFRLVRRRDLPFLIREHARKYQLGIAEATVWRRA